MSLLTAKEIMEIIPHRQPFMLLDTVEELVPGKYAVARKCVTYNEPFFQGHFPGEPVMPGVLIIEALAQAGAVAILSKEENRGKTAYFAAINSAKFKNKVIPGDVSGDRDNQGERAYGNRKSHGHCGRKARSQCGAYLRRFLKED